MTDKLKEKEEFRYAPIGVFDSGVGGLTVAREIMRQIPKERIIYFGDTARVPYGSKSKETIIRFSRQIIRFLQSKGVKAIVIACNTVHWHWKPYNRNLTSRFWVWSKQERRKRRKSRKMEKSV